MKKLDKHALASKASKIKENIKMPQVKLPHGKHSKKDDIQKTASKEEKAEEFQENMRQTDVSSGNVYRMENARRNQGQTGAYSDNIYRMETARRNRYQTGAITGNTYQTGTVQRNLGQTGAISGRSYQTGTAQRNFGQTGAISNNIYRMENVQRNLSQTGAVSDNVYRLDLTQRNTQQTEAIQDNIRRTKKPQRVMRQSEDFQENVRRTEAIQRNRHQTRNSAENAQQQRAPQRDGRKVNFSRRNVYQAEGAVQGAQRTKLPGAVAAYIKIALVAVLLLFIVLDLSNEPDSTARIETVAENVVKAAGLQASEPAEARMVKRFYGLNPKDYEGAVLYAPEDNMDAHELFLVKLKDDTQKKTVEDAIEERLNTQLKSFEGYGAEQTALLEKHVLSVKGNYVLYIVGEYAEDAQKAFAKSL